MKTFSKHTMFAMVAVLATSLFSCTKDDGKDAPGAEAMAKTSVTAFISSTSASPTGKSVNRGATVPVWVDKVTLSASNALAAWNVSETYDMVGSGGASNFVLDNVALGNNNFSASSTTNTVGLLTQTSIPALLDETTFNTVWKTKNPYVKYHSSLVTGDNQNVLITAGGTNLIKFGMVADNGRSMALFQMDPTLPTNHYTAKVTATISGAGASNGVLPTTTVSSANSTIIYWSNADAVTGGKIDYKIEILSGTTVVSTINRSYTIKNGDSNTCIYTVKQDNVIDNQSNFIMVFQQLNDTNNCGYDLDGYDYCTFKDNHGHNKSYYDDKGHGEDGCEHNGPQGNNHHN